MLNIERTVGTITPKKVFSFRESLLGVSEADSGVASDSAPHATALTARPHTPEVIKGVRSFDMVAGCFWWERPGQMRSGRSNVTAAGRACRTELSRELDAVKDVLPNNNTAAVARLVLLLFVQKCHGRVETAHVIAKRGGQICHKYEQM
ncbi:hypothetical protein FQN60_000909 [Etheostoma spectabile]|uniref:Uncharacterized protein n=1 Tax=Etheostoma spectabile TaxID=54343 RepID=A0A5J5D1M7_9PERO|nr:hypothetical protein FQN60_000909 [Etheostoma spectabile]